MSPSLKTFCRASNAKSRCASVAKTNERDGRYSRDYLVGIFGRSLAIQDLQTDLLRERKNPEYDVGPGVSLDQRSRASLGIRSEYASTSVSPRHLSNKVLL